MDALPVDPALAVREAAQNDLIRRKLDMDALRKRLGDNASGEEKLRESCEGFEAIFLQKLWEQMRKNVSKEGFLHSKDEEAYQSMFDVELCKKMASAGGIGLADMLYTQLSQQLENTGRSTLPASGRQFLPIPPAQGLLPEPQEQTTAPAASEKAADKKLTAENLYTPLERETREPEPEESAPGHTGGAAILGALDELKSELGLPPDTGPGAAARAWAQARDAATGMTPAPGPAGDAKDGPAAQPAPPAAAAAPERPGTGSGGIELASWQGPGPVSAKPRPISSFGKGGKSGKGKNAAASESPQPAQPRGIAPAGALWPLAGEQGTVTGRFGWEDDPATGRRHWNSGVRITADLGTPVRAVLPGTVVYAGQREGFGHTVVLEHKDGYRSYYSNLAQSPVKIGEHIQHGAEFAKIGAQPSPAANGENSASLLFELKKGEMALNPENAINRTVSG